jgi:hypothetical protein
VVTSACGAYSVLVSALTPGIQSVKLTLSDPAHPGQKATAPLEDITVIAGVRNDIGPIDIVCPFCPGG